MQDRSPGHCLQGKRFGSTTYWFGKHEGQYHESITAPAVNPCAFDCPARHGRQVTERVRLRFTDFDPNRYSCTDTDRNPTGHRMAPRLTSVVRQNPVAESNVYCAGASTEESGEQNCPGVHSRATKRNDIGAAGEPRTSCSSPSSSTTITSSGSWPGTYSVTVAIPGGRWIVWVDRLL